MYWDLKGFFYIKIWKENQLVYGLDVLNTAFVINEIELNYEKKAEIRRA